MSPRIPVELAHAKEQRAEAWRKYDEAVDRNADPLELDRLAVFTKGWQLAVTTWYNRWQALGGTSDIYSIEAREREQSLAAFGREAR